MLIHVQVDTQRTIMKTIAFNATPHVKLAMESMNTTALIHARLDL